MKNKTGKSGVLVVAAACVSLGACAVGPNYVKPSVEVPAAYKEATPQQLADAHAFDWNPAQPADAGKRSAWWEIFGDPTLDQFEQQVEVSNQSLAQAEAEYREARAQVSGARASYFPTVGISASATRAGNFESATGIPTPGGPVVRRTSDSFSLPLDASWEPDLWGKVRRTVEAEVGAAQASEATLESTRLSLQAELAQDYFQLRITDEQKRLLDDTVVAYQHSLQLTQNQYNVGVAARADVVTAEAQLKGAQAQAIDAGIARAQLEHAVALLVGKTPADVSIAVEKLAVKPPEIPVGVPSQLLERRPDVAAAERAAASASAQIGVAKSLYFPSLTLTAGGGFESESLSKLLTVPSEVWSLGATLAETLIDGGLRRAQVAEARAAYDAAVANYREVSLAAFQNVEDNLAALRILEKESAVQADAVKSAEEALKITLNQYRAGTVSYLNVVTAQATAYGDERNEITILGTQLNDSVALIKAVGGGWQDSDLPAARDISLRDPAAPAKKPVSE